MALSGSQTTRFGLMVIERGTRDFTGKEETAVSILRKIITVVLFNRLTTVKG